MSFGQLHHRSLIVGHRGAASLAPENTLAGLRAALDLGVDAIEIDVRLSRDGVVVLSHDPGLGRVGGRPEQMVAEMTLNDLRACDVGGWFGPAFVGEPVPRLIEAMELIGNRAVLAIEVKPADITAAVVADIRRAHAAGIHVPVIVMSFHAEVVREVRRLAPDLDTGWIVDAGTVTDESRARQVWDSLAATARDIDAGYLSVNHGALTPDLISLAIDAGYPLWTWTVRDAARARELATWGVNAIIYDDPRLGRDM